MLLEGTTQIPLWGWIVIGVVLLTVIFLLGTLSYTAYSDITGFGPHVVKETVTLDYDEVGEDAEPTKKTKTTEKQTPRTIWDWMTILTISAVIGLAALYFTWSQAQKQQDIQDQQARDDVLQAYLDQMTEMMLDNKNPLLKSEARSPERIAARVRTVTVIKRLDGEHNRIVITFLKESGLIAFHSGPPGSTEADVVRLDRAPLSGVDLSNNGLASVDLRFVKLRNADLDDSDLGNPFNNI
jgi:hypothetical protein